MVVAPAAGFEVVVSGLPSLTAAVAASLIGSDLGVNKHL